jgi:acetyl-CoA synthetase
MSFVWTPSDDVVERANVTRLGLRHDLDSYPELLARSQEHIEWFWPAVVEDLAIEFTRPWVRVLDTSRGVQWPLWFVGGEVNVAHNCVDRHRRSGRIALIFEGEEGTVRAMTYEELAADVARLTDGLRALGVRRGDPVALFLPTVPEAVVAFMACAKAGAIAVPIFSGLPAGAVAVRLEDVEAKVLVCADGFHRRGELVPMKDTADEAVAGSAYVERVVVVRRAGRSCAMHAGRDVFWDELVDGRPADARTEHTTAEDPLMVAYTPNAGRPDGAVHVHGGFLVKVAAEVAYHADYRPGETLFWLSDPGCVMGAWQIVGTLALGGTLLLYDGAPDHPGPDRLWDMVARHRVNVIGLPPAVVRALTAAGDDTVARHDLSSLRILASAGGAWDGPPFMWYFERVGGGRCPVISISAGTEIGACFLSPTPVVPLAACSNGGPALGMAIDVFDKGGKPVRGDTGTLVCTKPWPSMTRGIWGDPDRYIETYWSRWANVWSHGACASIDANGQWFVHGGVPCAEPG